MMMVMMMVMMMMIYSSTEELKVGRIARNNCGCNAKFTQSLKLRNYVIVRLHELTYLNLA